MDGPVRVEDVEASAAACRSDGARIRFPMVGAAEAVLSIIGAGFTGVTVFLTVGVWRWCSSSEGNISWITQEWTMYYLHCSGVASHIANSPASLSVGRRPITIYDVKGRVRIRAV